MQVYVQSRGFDQDHGYCWVTAGRDASPVRADAEWQELVQEFGVLDLVQLDSPCVVLARRNGQLLLVVSALPTGRTDFQGRPVRSAITWRATESTITDATLRHFAANALKTELTIIVDVAKMPKDDEPGFTVDFAALSRNETVEFKDVSVRIETPREATKTPIILRQLADELLRASLPANSLLIVVGENLAPETLEQVERRLDTLTWRFASNLVASSSWVEKKKTLRSRLSRRARGLIIAAVCLIGFLLLAILAYMIVAPR